ncbi:hypothetical protein J4457_03955 [Candidatus Woesearchaeota archaeon]|nr:hypothetical protein [Candidatus Woesearchaeota archaeon]
MDKKIGHYSFIVGVIIAIVAGLFPEAIGQTALLLLVLGLIVGFLNVTTKETTSFLIAAIALLVSGAASNFGVIAWIGMGTIVDAILINITNFVAPAAVVVALKAVFSLAEG